MTPFLTYEHFLLCNSLRWSQYLDLKIALPKAIMNMMTRSKRIGPMSFRKSTGATARRSTRRHA